MAAGHPRVAMVAPQAGQLERLILAVERLLREHPEVELLEVARPTGGAMSRSPYLRKVSEAVHHVVAQEVERLKDPGLGL